MMLSWFSKKVTPIDLSEFPKIESAPRGVLYRLSNDKDTVVRAKPRYDDRFREEAAVELTALKKSSYGKNLRALCEHGYFQLKLLKERGVYVVAGIREGKSYPIGHLPNDVTLGLQDEPEIRAGFEMADFGEKKVEVVILTLHLKEKRKIMAAETASFRIALDDQDI